MLTVTSEFSSGMIRATFAAVPRRPLVLAAKAAVVAAVTLAAGEILAFAAFDVGVLFVLPLILVPLGSSIQNAAGQFMPMLIAENSLTAVRPVAHSLSPGAGFALLCAYALAALTAGGWALARRDA